MKERCAGQEIFSANAGMTIMAGNVGWSADGNYCKPSDGESNLMHVESVQTRE